jgi:hypothetical protein
MALGCNANILANGLLGGPMNHFVRTLVIVLSTALAGCSTTTLAPPGADAEAKRFVVPPGKARLYVVRCSSQGGVYLMQAVLDGRVLGDLQARSYLVVDVPPGDHTLSLGAASLGSQVQSFRAEPDRAYYFVLHAFHSLQQDPPEAGQDCVRNSSRVSGVSNL